MGAYGAAQALLRSGTAPKKTPCLRRSALALNPDLPEAHCVKGATSNEGLSKKRSGISDWRSSSRLDLEASREMAAFLYRHGRHRGAIPFFDKAASMMETDTSSAGMLARLLSTRKREKGNSLRQRACASGARNERSLTIRRTRWSWRGEQRARVPWRARIARDWGRRALLVRS